MNERSDTISRLCSNLDARASYVKAKLGVLVPSQIKALRLKSNMPRQSDLAREAKMHQSRISVFETPGAANLTIETLSRLAAAFKVGLIIEFVSFSEMLRWENDFSQDSFDVLRIERDRDFLQGTQKTQRWRRRKSRASAPIGVSDQRTPTGRATVSGQAAFPFALPAAGAGIIRIRPEQVGSGQCGELLNALASRGGIPDGRQKYPASTAASEERAVG